MKKGFHLSCLLNTVQLLSKAASRSSRSVSSRGALGASQILKYIFAKSADLTKATISLLNERCGHLVFIIVAQCIAISVCNVFISLM
ncbi:unknown protein [Desulfotalea psychrophila LSv54]|uniref:Uncharacterized protein n=1 Tax=Desulfotalea psychrophila (strain LSv54 / DSM 12343) TaxID=177439 RepID=Q6ALA1_DESPS|nr:unknown protein [Desulfotalea psychrophila LSv54]